MSSKEQPTEVLDVQREVCLYPDVKTRRSIDEKRETITNEGRILIKVK